MSRASTNRRSGSADAAELYRSPDKHFHRDRDRSHSSSFGGRVTVDNQLTPLTGEKKWGKLALGPPNSPGTSNFSKRRISASFGDRFAIVVTDASAAKPAAQAVEAVPSEDQKVSAAPVDSPQRDSSEPKESIKETSSPVEDEPLTIDQAPILPSKTTTSTATPSLPAETPEPVKAPSVEPTPSTAPPLDEPESAEMPSQDELSVDSKQLKLSEKPRIEVPKTEGKYEPKLPLSKSGEARNSPKSQNSQSQSSISGSSTLSTIFEKIDIFEKIEKMESPKILEAIIVQPKERFAAWFACALAFLLLVGLNIVTLPLFVCSVLSLAYFLYTKTRVPPRRCNLIVPAKENRDELRI